MKTVKYKTALIQDPESIGLDNLIDMEYNLLGFFRYVVSLHETMIPEGTEYYNTTFKVKIVTNRGLGYSIPTLFELDFNDFLDFGHIEYNERHPGETFTKPLEFYFTVQTIYSFVEGELPPPVISKSFQTDKCVVCLDNSPSILYFKCLHYNVCEECEKANPFWNCPTCRAIIETKVSIYKIT